MTPQTPYTYRLQIENDIILAATSDWPHTITQPELEFIHALAARLAGPQILPSIATVQPVHCAIIGHAIRRKLLHRDDTHAVSDTAVPTIN